MSPMTSYTLITRMKNPQPSFKFQKLPEPCGPFGKVRGTPYQFMQRLREFPPNLLDAIIVASTASGDVGLVTRSKTALTSELPADQTTNVFVTTNMAEDSRRAQLPMTITEEMGVDTSPIGIAVDLSSKDKVSRPLPKEEFDESAGSLPALMILNNEGVLMTWWIVYAESIRQKTSFPGLAALGGMQSQQPPQDQRQASPFGSAGPRVAPAFGQSAFGHPSTTQSTLGPATSKPATSAFGATSAPGTVFGASAPAFGTTTAASGTLGSANTAPTFGAPSAQNGAFGSSPTLGKPASLWGDASGNSSVAPAFGKPSFGSSTTIGGSASGLAFGQTGGLGRSSPWVTQGGSAFGQTGSMGTKATPFGGGSTATSFGSTAATAGSSPAPASGFASFASQPSGFLAAGTTTVQNVFEKPSSGSTFSPGMNADTPFGQTSKNDEASKPAFGGGSGFTLGSTFKADGTAANDGPKPTENAVGSVFGSNFGDVLGRTQTETPQTKDADMDDDSDDASKINSKEQSASKNTAGTSKPAEAPKPTSPFPQKNPPKSSGLHTTQSQSKTTPAEVGTIKPAQTWPLGRPTPNIIAPKEIHVKGKDPPATKPSQKIKAEPEDSEDEQFSAPLHEEEAATPLRSKKPDTPSSEGSKPPEVPLPPESTSKASFAPGDSSNSSKSSNEEPAEVPLPSEPFPTKSKLSKVESASAEPPLPPDPFPPKSKIETRKIAPAQPPGLPNEDEDEGLDTEGSGVDVAQEFSSPSDQAQSPKVTPDTSFTFPKSPAGGLFSKAPSQQALPKGPPLFGEVDTTSREFGKPSAPFFPPPNKKQQSPRSPSPVRQSQLSLDALRPDNSRSISAPGPLRAIANRKATMNQLAVPPKQSQPSSIELRKQEEQRIAAERAKQAAEEEQSLSDDDDEQVRCELETPVAGSRSLDPFLAHQDYVGNIDKPGVPGQIEKVYRDINSMIDTLGLNARSLTAFVKGHTEQNDDDEISTEHLERPDDFALEEIPKLIALEAHLSDELDNHRILDVQGNLSTCRDIRKDIQSLHHKRNDITKAIESRNDPEIVETALSAPLSLEQASQQHDLRKKFAHFQRLLAQAEENITMLRAKLASCDQSRPSSSAGLPGQKKPTVEAVTKTILKMTNMVEKKSGDIDMLEAQLRNLRLPSVEGGQSSREGSPFTASNRWKPGGVKGSFTGKSLQNGEPMRSSPLRRSLNGDGSPKKGLDGLVAEEVLQYREKARRRKEVNALVRHVFEKTGPRIRGLD